MCAYLQFAMISGYDKSDSSSAESPIVATMFLLFLNLWSQAFDSEMKKMEVRLYNKKQFIGSYAINATSKAISLGVFVTHIFKSSNVHQFAGSLTACVAANKAGTFLGNAVVNAVVPEALNDSRVVLPSP